VGVANKGLGKGCGDRTAIRVKYTKTRLPSNLRLTTRECMHLVTRGHFRSRDKDGGHTIRSAVSKNPMLHANFNRTIADRSFTRRKWGFSNLFASVTLTLTDDLHIRTWPIFPRDIPGVQKMNFLRQGCRKLSSDKHTDRSTRPKLLYRFVGGQ